MHLELYIETKLQYENGKAWFLSLKLTLSGHRPPHRCKAAPLPQQLPARGRSKRACESRDGAVQQGSRRARQG